MSRKNIAICVTGYDWESETKVVKGIYEECQKRDINILVFSSLMRKPPLNFKGTINSYVIRGESEIYNLINYSLVDGIIILGESFMDRDMAIKLNNKAIEKKVPLINVNDPEHPAQYNIELSDDLAMEKIMDHLLNDHKLTRINFIGGYKGNIQTEERLKAYRTALEKKGIAYDEKRVGYGEFWIRAKECTAEFLKEPELPQAIACANDTMAFFAIDTIKAHGLRVPEDIIVTGFDGIADCEVYSPSLTSVRRDFVAAGVKAVEMLCDIWSGKDVPRKIFTGTELLKNQSCGCKAKVDASLRTYSEQCSVKNIYGEFNSDLQNMNMQFPDISTSNELYECANVGAKFFGMKKLFICICSGIENADRSIQENETGTAKYGLTDYVVNMFSYGSDTPVGMVFNKNKLLPIDILHNEKPCFFAFSPLYYNRRFLGYVAYEPEGIICAPGELFATWCMQIGNNAGSFYMRNELQYAVKQLEDMNSKDPLTSLYNRRGMNRKRVLVEEAIKARRLVTCVVSDVDNLKKVNDVYGHEGGDIVIKQVANAISFALPEDSICVRTGGDEFCAFFVHKGDENVESMLYEINEHLENFNSHSGLPYKAECSCGFVTQIPASMEEFDDMLREADEKMYAVKMGHKAARN